MTQDVRQWLNEIKALQQQLAEITRDREAALESAAQWRQLYNTEAQQRRTEAKLNQQTIATLQAQIQKLQSFSPSIPDETKVVSLHQQQVEELQTLEEIKIKLVEVLLERDRAREEINHLASTLKQEQTRHSETRKNLTTALGDAVDLLSNTQKPTTPSIKFGSDINPTLDSP
jgi:transcription elongation GreA/GreB family factor